MFSVGPWGALAGLVQKTVGCCAGYTIWIHFSSVVLKLGNF